MLESIPSVRYSNACIVFMEYQSHPIYRVIELVKKENVGTQILILSGVHIRTT